MKRNKPYLHHMLDAISDIDKFLEGITQNEFFKNKEKQYAVFRALEIIGEATKNLNKELRSKYRDIPWKDIAGMRDKLIHGYFGVKLELIWGTVKDRIPELKEQIHRILNEINETEENPD